MTRLKLSNKILKISKKNKVRFLLFKYDQLELVKIYQKL